MSGSLYCIGYQTNKKWKHGIPEVNTVAGRAMGRRISLVFSRLKDGSAPPEPAAKRAKTNNNA